MVLPPFDVEVIWCGIVTSLGVVHMDGRGFLQELHHIQSTKDFVKRVSKVTLLPGECLCSYDVTTLFTSVPIDPALNIREQLEQDTTLWDRIVLSVQSITELLGSCACRIHAFLLKTISMNRLRCGYGVTGQPHSAKPVYGAFGKKALSTASTPRHWFRFVDDTFFINKSPINNYF